MKKLLSDKVRLLHIRDAIMNIESFTKNLEEAEYLKDILVQSAVERQLEIIGEAAANISSDLKSTYNEIEWHKVKALRNVIAHEYFGVSSKQVWTVINNDLPELKDLIIKKIEKI